MKHSALTCGQTYTRTINVPYNTTNKDVLFFYPRMVSANSAHCCPGCGHIIGGRMKWDYPPVAEIPMVGDGQDQTLYVGTVLAECPECKSFFAQTEVTSYDRETVESFIAKARPAETKS
jgi:hypothetical protein